MTQRFEVRYEKDTQKVLKKMDKFQAAMILSWIEKTLLVQIILDNMGKDSSQTEVESGAIEWEIIVSSQTLTIK